jgi:hypothetical protein
LSAAALPNPKLKQANKMQSQTARGRNVVVVGTQWGDEGKGKVVDWMTDHAEGVVRFQGGHNAGHTLVIKGVKTALQLIPAASCATAWPATSAMASCWTRPIC